YKKALGIISLSSYPMANISIPEGGAEFLVTYPEWSTYTIDKNSYVVKFNPDIINSSSEGARIENLKSNFVCPASYYLISNPLGTMGSNNGMTTEVIGGVPYVAIDLNVRDYPIMLNLNPNNIGEDAYSQIYTPGQSLPNAYLRISFDVVPNNGAAKSTNVKTFRIITTYNEYDYLAV
ncbi:MAG: hypothetical protein WAM41_17885, partial [Psychrobacillus psychrotolerans]|uniref:hypothetical protein n=1 Tax=Psychrobacillus psychrotolerans TaxID=126156 RepID=UPI003BB05AA5